MSIRSKKPVSKPARTVVVPPSGKTISTKAVTDKAAAPSSAAARKPRAPVTPVTPTSPIARKAASQIAPATPAKPKLAKPAKVKKPKLVRDSFTIPKAEYSVLIALKHRAAQLTSPAKKSELLRAGVKALSVMSDLAFLAALKAVPTIKTGRPAKSKSS